MSLGISVVESSYTSESYDISDTVSREFPEKSSNDMLIHHTELQWEPKSFTTPKLDVGDLSHFNELEYDNYSCSDVSSESSESPPAIVILGDGFATMELAEHFGDQSELTIFNGIADGDNPRLFNADFYIIAFSDTVDEKGNFDVSELEAAIDTLQEYVQPGVTVIIESAVPVGTTRRLLEPLIFSYGVKGGISATRTISPEKVEHCSTSTAKLIAGLDDLSPGSLLSIHSLYTQSFPRVVCVSSPEVAEMATFHENGRRVVAYANEMADASAPVGIDPFEVCFTLSRSSDSSEPSTPTAGAGGMYADSFFNYIGSVGL